MTVIAILSVITIIFLTIFITIFIIVTTTVTLTHSPDDWLILFDCRVYTDGGTTFEGGTDTASSSSSIVSTQQAKVIRNIHRN